MATVALRKAELSSTLSLRYKKSFHAQASVETSMDKVRHSSLHATHDDLLSLRHRRGVLQSFSSGLDLREGCCEDSTI